jgi:F-type H+-transporting ATPase subunit delta
MKISREARRQAREIFDLTLVDGRLDTARLDVAFDEVSTKKPRDYFSILKELARLVRLELTARHAIIESAVPMDPAKAAAFADRLKARFGDITTEFRQSPELIGGLRVRVGSDVWDGSVQARLEAIKQL